MIQKMIGVAALLLACGTSHVQAGVNGSHWVGDLTYAADASVSSAAVKFSGTEFVEERLGQEYAGTFYELALGLISYWSGRYDDYPNYGTSGFSFFGVVTTYRIDQFDGNSDAFGILFKAGTTTP